MGEKASMWNLWHGCHKLSDGCRHCSVYRTDGKYGKDVYKRQFTNKKGTGDFLIFEVSNQKTRKYE